MLTVDSASLVKLPGYQLPHLVSVGVVPGCLGNGDISAGTNEQNQVTVTVGSQSVQLLPIRGYRMHTGDSSCVPTLVYVVQDLVPGRYAAAGLQLVVTAGGRKQTVTGYDGVFVWYFGSGGEPSTSQYQARFNAASSAQSSFYRQD